MPKALKIRFLLVVAISCLVFAVAYFFDKSYATGIAWSFLNGETSIGFWLKSGVSLRKAVLIAIACSTLATYVCFWLADQSMLILTKSRIIAPEERPADQNGRLHRWFKRAPYLTLPIFGFIPGWIWTGIALSKLFRLNNTAAFLLLTSGNSVKMVFFGLGFNVAGIIFRFLSR